MAAPIIPAEGFLEMVKALEAANPDKELGYVLVVVEQNQPPALMGNLPPSATKELMEFCVAHHENVGVTAIIVEDEKPTYN